ncbi:MAG: GntR family transcriptional regulator [Proteobacteria bacterium]|nr:GntR family transcriptional regulator [Pseudomonadota bacterium]
MSALIEARRPLYHTVAERLSLAIHERIYPVGVLLPSEAELCAQYGVSRHTVREAIRRLQQAGLVTSEHGIGTRVERDRVEARYLQTLASISDLWQYVKDTRRKPLDLRDVLPGEARMELPGDPAVPWRMLEGIRYLVKGRQPVSWTQIHVHPNYAKVINRKTDDAVPIYSLIERRFGLRVGRVRQEIAALAIPADIAALLKVPVESPGLAIVRYYESEAGEVVEATLSIHPAERYRYSMQLDLAYGT